MRHSTLSLVLPLLLLSCRPSIDPNLGVFRPAPCPLEIPEGSRAGLKVDCGYVTVPERHAMQSGPVLEIAVARFPSTGQIPEPDPLVLNTGGPGDSNMDEFFGALSGAPGESIVAKRDAVIIELRGLPHSRPSLVCEEVYQAQEGMVEQDLKGAEANEILLAGMRDCHDRLVREGVNLSAFNNVETAADIAMIMTALGYDRFNLFGSSAGTLVAQHVMRDYPERVRSVVLNATVAMGNPFLKEMIPNAARALQRLFRMCEEDDACRAAYPEMEKRFLAYLDELNRTPVTVQLVSPDSGVDVSFVLNGDRLATWIFASMYGNTQIPATLKRLMGGDYTELQKSAQIFFPLRRFAYGLSYSIFLAEYMDFEPDDTRIEDKYAAYADGISLFFGAHLLAQAQSVWKVEPVDRRLSRPFESDIPTLLLNGELDHVLPPAYIERITAHWSNSHVFVFPGVAHSPIDSHGCAYAMALAFVDDPATAPDGSCLKGLKHAFALIE
jgi:pimeloyl-ACP methyl ester carboxylesterase